MSTGTLLLLCSGVLPVYLRLAQDLNFRGLWVLTRVCWCNIDVI